jgi:hypothetical protein
MSFASAGSVLSAQARDAMLVDSNRSEVGLLSAGILLACGVAIAGWAFYRNRTGQPRTVR